MIILLVSSINKIYLKPSTTLSDLWLQTIADDQHAYALLHKNLYPGLYNYLLQMIKDEDLAHDLLQELFVKIWDKRKQLKVINNIKAYFFTACRSIAINHFRKVKVQTARLEQRVLPELSFSPEDMLVSAEEDMYLKNIMAAALKSLPARQREIIYLKYYQEMEYPKIAELTGIQYQSVINHVFRALETLRVKFSHFKTEEIFVNFS